ncbi:hypothetical protein BamMEX5DRAFT_0332 [Burkholderia ambifaria MEX-5]|uniref:Uncharacterized protein n=1 Tax=Burkholderia ambifaria MEX-5 TaxID=396597 RepID=B1SXR6_9BURK|nr:hypothetical protein BamMEX5DRAFT_0332 [Burkholderia ambifaria MEX-5]
MGQPFLQYRTGSSRFQSRWKRSCRILAMEPRRFSAVAQVPVALCAQNRFSRCLLDTCVMQNPGRIPIGYEYFRSNTGRVGRIVHQRHPTSARCSWQAGRVRVWVITQPSPQHGHRPYHRDQQKTNSPVQFEISGQTRDARSAWVACAGLRAPDCLVPNQVYQSPHLATWQRSTGVPPWIRGLGGHTQCARKSRLLSPPKARFHNGRIHFRAPICSRR